MTEQTFAPPEDAEDRPFPFQVGAPVEHRGIVVAPLFPLRDPVARYVTLDHALARGLEVTETGPEGHVPELELENPLDDDVLLYDGEELVGARQSRILNVSVLVGAGAKLVAPVSCVELGRSGSVSPRFAAARHVAHLRLRRAKTEALAVDGTASPGGSVQHQVWGEVHATLERLGIPSPTHAAGDASVAHEPAIRALECAFAAEPGQCGAVLGLGDTLCLDVVSRPDAFALLWPKLRKGYLLDALEWLDCRPTRPERLLGFVDEVADAPIRRRAALGRGTRVRGEGPGVIATGLDLDGELIQLSAFGLEPGPEGDGRTGGTQERRGSRSRSRRP